MKSLISSLAVAIGCAAITGCVTANECTAKKCEGNRPSLFASFGENVNVPDGMTQDAEGNIYMSVPNYIDKTYAPVIMRRCAKKGRWSIFVQARLNEKTGRAGPMGIELGPDGNLYYCDHLPFFAQRRMITGAYVLSM